MVAPRRSSLKASHSACHVCIEVQWVNNYKTEYRMSILINSHWCAYCVKMAHIISDDLDDGVKFPIGPGMLKKRVAEPEPAKVLRHILLI